MSFAKTYVEDLLYNTRGSPVTQDDSGHMDVGEMCKFGRGTGEHLLSSLSRSGIIHLSCLITIRSTTNATLIERNRSMTQSFDPYHSTQPGPVVGLTSAVIGGAGSLVKVDGCVASGESAVGGVVALKVAIWRSTIKSALQGSKQKNQ